MVYVLKVQSRVGLVDASEQSPKCVDDCGFPCVVGADEDVQALLEL
jgi:hypothetical protein